VHKSTVILHFKAAVSVRIRFEAAEFGCQARPAGSVYELKETISIERGEEEHPPENMVLAFRGRILLDHETFLDESFLSGRVWEAGEVINMVMIPSPSEENSQSSYVTVYHSALAELYVVVVPTPPVTGGKIKAAIREARGHRAGDQVISLLVGPRPSRELDGSMTLGNMKNVIRKGFDITKNVTKKGLQAGKYVGKKGLQAGKYVGKKGLQAGKKGIVSVITLGGQFGDRDGDVDLEAHRDSSSEEAQVNTFGWAMEPGAEAAKNISDPDAQINIDPFYDLIKLTVFKGLDDEQDD
jgi:hypothetical protein